VVGRGASLALVAAGFSATAASSELFTSKGTASEFDALLFSLPLVSGGGGQPGSR
jgi:hypothetical protein